MSKEDRAKGAKVPIEKVTEELGDPNSWWRDDAITEFELRNPPDLKLTFIEERPRSKPFLQTRRGWYELTYADGTKSRQFQYDSILRRSLNAAIIFAHGKLDGVHVCYLRSCVRPALLHAEPVPPHGANIWECAAGLVDNGESPQQAAKRECMEELGFDMPLEAFKELGNFSFPAVGIMGERHYFYEVEVDHAKQQVPSLDGSPLEHGGTVLHVPVTGLHNMVMAGLIHDSKTEIAITRFVRKLNSR